MHIDLLLLQLKHPENVGACYRLASQFNVDHIYQHRLATKKVGSTDTSKAARHIAIKEVDNLTEFMLNYDGYKVLLETGGTQFPPKEMMERIWQKEPILIAVANEGRGATKEQIALFDVVWTLPAPAHISYNVSNALAIGLHRVVYG
jgi:tRNA G18 (ribose-2'-O)-methylase SpoU